MILILNIALYPAIVHVKTVGQAPSILPFYAVNRATYEIWFHTCEVFWVGHGVRQLLVALDLRWHRRHHHAIWELLFDASGKVLLPGVDRDKSRGAQSCNLGREVKRGANRRVEEAKARQEDTLVKDVLRGMVR